MTKEIQDLIKKIEKAEEIAKRLAQPAKVIIPLEYDRHKQQHNPVQQEIQFS